MIRPLQRDSASPEPPPVPLLVVYGRGNCHLCDVAKAAIDALRSRVDFDVKVLDVDTNADWANAYGDQVPVGFIGERKVFKYRVDPDSLERALLSGR
jgi:hypothetical protein